MEKDGFFLDRKKYFGRPKNRRSAQEEACYGLLDSLNIPYARADHDAAMTIELCHQVEVVLEAKICKNLFLCNRQKTDFYLLLIDGDKIFKTKYLSSQLGCSRLSFAEGAQMEALLGVQPGSASVLALRNDKAQKVRLVIDRSVLNKDYFACHPCINTATVSFLTRDLEEKLLPALGHVPTIVDLPEVEE